MNSTNATGAYAETRASKFRPVLLSLLDDLPLSKQIELVDFARFLQQQVKIATPPIQAAGNQVELRTATVATLTRLTGLVNLGGDALADAEALYDGA